MFGCGLNTFTPLGSGLNILGMLILVGGLEINKMKGHIVADLGEVCTTLS